MKALKETGEAYFEELKKRSGKSKVYRSYQALGLEIAEVLGDRKHKALYMKLAKKHNPQSLLAMAKSVSERKGIANKGAYFMTVLSNKKHDAHIDHRK